MTQTTTGWMMLVAAIGMMFGLLAVDITTLKNWNELATPLFVGTTMGHIAAVIAAFIGGKIIPAERDITRRDRVSDSKLQELNK